MVRFDIAERKDAGRIGELFAEMLRTIFSTEAAEGYGEGELDRFFSGGEDRIYVAKDHGEIVGFLSVEVHREEREFLYLDDFSVSASHRRRGIGSALLDLAEMYACALGICTVCLHVEASNADARRLYERRGFAIPEEQGGRYLMGKRLTCVARAPEIGGKIQDESR